MTSVAKQEWHAEYIDFGYRTREDGNIGNRAVKCAGFDSIVQGRVPAELRIGKYRHFNPALGCALQTFFQLHQGNFLGAGDRAACAQAHGNRLSGCRSRPKRAETGDKTST